jgi:hypothetical protein
VLGPCKLQIYYLLLHCALHHRCVCGIFYCVLLPLSLFLEAYLGFSLRKGCGVLGGVRNNESVGICDGSADTGISSVGPVKYLGVHFNLISSDSHYFIF